MLVLPAYRVPSVGSVAKQLKVSVPNGVPAPRTVLAPDVVSTEKYVPGLFKAYNVVNLPSLGNSTPLRKSVTTRFVQPSFLTKALSDEREHVRAECVNALGGISASAKAAIPALKDALQDPSKEVRDAAAGALKQIGS